MKRTALLSVFLMMIAVPAFAVPANYLALKLGGYFPQNRDMNGYAAGFNEELAFGHYFHPKVALEYSVGYLNSTGSEAGVSVDITSYPILLSLKVVAPLTGGELYAFAGGGIYITKLDGSASGRNISRDDTPFGFHFGVGGNIDLSTNMFLGYEAKYLWAKPSFSLPEWNTLGWDINGIQATANIGYRF